MEKFKEIFLFIHLKKCYLIPPIVCVSVFLLSFRHHTLKLFPGIAGDRIEAFADHKTGGNSKLNIFTNDSSSVTVGYTLRERIQYPYAGMKLLLKNGSSYLNLSPYDYFSIEIDCEHSQEVNVYLHTIIPGFTDESRDLSYRYLLKPFKCGQGRKRFTVPIEAFAVPTWWYVLNKVPDDSLPAETFREVAEIIVENGPGNTVNTPYTFTLREMSFRKNMVKRGIPAAAVCLLWFLVYALFFLLYKSRESSEKKKVVISYEPLEVNNDSDECFNRIVAYIAKEYSNPNLTVKRIANEVGVLPARITQILREKKSCSYKQYLNAIRLTEAKRLLRETDRNIIDIVTRVGYNNVTHFNRIFKETEGITPRQFRASASE